MGNSGLDESQGGIKIVGKISVTSDMSGLDESQGGIKIVRKISVTSDMSGKSGALQFIGLQRPDTT